MHVAKARQIVHRACFSICGMRLTLVERESACARDGEQVQEFATADVRHFFGAFLELDFVGDCLDAGLCASIICIAPGRARYGNGTQ